MYIYIYRRFGRIINAVDPQPGNWFWFCFVFVSCVRACVRAKLCGRARACASHRWWPECPDVLVRRGFSAVSSRARSLLCARVLRIVRESWWYVQGF